MAEALFDWHPLPWRVTPAAMESPEFVVDAKGTMVVQSWHRTPHPDTMAFVARAPEIAAALAAAEERIAVLEKALAVAETALQAIRAPQAAMSTEARIRAAAGSVTRHFKVEASHVQHTIVVIVAPCNVEAVSAATESVRPAGVKVVVIGVAEMLP